MKGRSFLGVMPAALSEDTKDEEALFLFAPPIGSIQRDCIVAALLESLFEDTWTEEELLSSPSTFSKRSKRARSLAALLATVPAMRCAYT